MVLASLRAAKLASGVMDRQTLKKLSSKDQAKEAFSSHRSHTGNTLANPWGLFTFFNLGTSWLFLFFTMFLGISQVFPGYFEVFRRFSPFLRSFHRFCGEEKHLELCGGPSSAPSVAIVLPPEEELEVESESAAW